MTTTPTLFDTPSQDFTVHQRENNTESQTNLNENREHFSKQCKDLYNYLMTGAECNGDKAKELFGIRHLPRRYKDLKDAPNCVLISDKWENGMKTLFMTPFQININRAKFGL